MERKRSITTSSSFHGSNAGLTFIELVLVLFVLSLAGFLVYPNLQAPLQGVRGEAAVRKTASFLNDVRRRSIMEKEEYILRRDGESNRLLVFKDGNEEGEDADGEMTIPDKVQIVSLEPEFVRYYPRGYSSGMVLVLQDLREREYTIEVGTFTGLTRVEKK